MPQLNKKIQNQGIKVVLFCTLWIKSFTEPSLLHFEWQVRLMTLPKSLLFQYIGCVTVRLVPSLMANDRTIVNVQMVRPFEMKRPRNYIFLFRSSLTIIWLNFPIFFLFFFSSSFYVVLSNISLSIYQFDLRSKETMICLSVKFNVCPSDPQAIKLTHTFVPHQSWRQNFLFVWHVLTNLFCA